MANPFERVFKPNLENDTVFDAQVSKQATKLLDEYGVNMMGIRSAYARAMELNRQRTRPQHRNYVLNLVRGAALNSHRFDTDGLLNQNLSSDLMQIIEQLKQEE